MAENDFERTEAPTPRRRQEARRDGQVARSQDLTAAFAMLAAMVFLYLLGLDTFTGMRRTVSSMLGGEMTANHTRADDVGELLAMSGGLAVATILPLILCITAIAVMANLGQVGLMITTKPLQPDITKLSPLRGLKNLFSMRAVMRLVMSMAKLAVIAGVAMWAIHGDMPMIVGLSQLEPLPLFGASCELMFSLGLKLAVLLLLLGILDYTFQRQQHEKELRMTKQQVKEEMKRMEGDPMIRQRRMRVARQLAMQRIGQTVPQADVIVTNPTHFSIALKYDKSSMGAPKVVAKGADFLAMRIRQIAMANGVPLVERKEIAQGLYRSVEVGQEVPPEFYSAVAEILAYVYRLSGRKSA